MIPTRDIISTIEVNIAEIKKDIVHLKESVEKLAVTWENRCSALRTQCETKYVHQNVIWKIGVIVAGAMLLGGEGIKQILPLIKHLL